MGITIYKNKVQVNERQQFTESEMKAYVLRYEKEGWIVQNEIIDTAKASYPQKYHYEITRVKLEQNNAITATYRIKEVA